MTEELEASHDDDEFPVEYAADDWTIVEPSMGHTDGGGPPSITTLPVGKGPERRGGPERVQALFRVRLTHVDPGRIGAIVAQIAPHAYETISHFDRLQSFLMDVLYGALTQGEFDVQLKRKSEAMIKMRGTYIDMERALRLMNDTCRRLSMRGIIDVRSREMQKVWKDTIIGWT